LTKDLSKNILLKVRGSNYPYGNQNRQYGILFPVLMA
jgi:hypothetical protein